MIFDLLSDEYAVCRLPLGQASRLTPHHLQGAVWSLSVTDDEASLICPAMRAPEAERQERGWRILKLRGPFAFGTVGVMAGITGALAAAEIALMAFSTFDTDYFLVKEERLPAAIAALHAQGHTIHEP